MSDIFESYHPDESTPGYATVVVPLALPKVLSYAVPPALFEDIMIGQRAEVQVGKSKVYAGIIIDLQDSISDGYEPKPLLSIIDDHPIINEQQIRFWKWLAAYYCCTLGEVMIAALPANLKLTSEVTIVPSPLFNDDYPDLNHKEYLIAEALKNNKEMTIAAIQKLLKQKTVYPLIKKLIDKRYVFVKEDLKERYIPKIKKYIHLSEHLRADNPALNDIFKALGKAPRQEALLLAYFQMSTDSNGVEKKALFAKAEATAAHLNPLIKKGILYESQEAVNRFDGAAEGDGKEYILSEQQTVALKSIEEQFDEKTTVLLHGVTGSGKTNVYIDLIKKTIARGGKVLYLVPEIALTTQIIKRLQDQLGTDVIPYHSRLNNNERVDIWQKVIDQHPVVLGARSSIFLPFQKLDLIIVDEEHDSSFKQYDPAPRYNARDAAIVLANLLGAKVLLGTATPSIESIHNVRTDKYGLAELKERYGGLALPKIEIIDLKKEVGVGKVKQISQPLTEGIQKALDNQEQVILFQNRRGYSPIYHCQSCGWSQKCINCDVNLTYHKYFERLNCHYCGHNENLPDTCPACGSHGLELKGFGTERIEDELTASFPEARIHRLDLDTVRSKFAYEKIIYQFENREIDILIGTQMVTKGLDFEHVSLVGVVSADMLMAYPDFRSSERAYQLMMQVAGRPGRIHKQGHVMIQTYQPDHRILHHILHGSHDLFIKEELAERKEFKYPPFERLIKIAVKHKKTDTLNDATKILVSELRKHLQHRVLGPSIPYISRVRGQYILEIVIKLERNQQFIKRTKKLILESALYVKSIRGLSTVRINVDVDPM